ncbi:MAG: DUF6757 family protein [Halobacteriaceae archaeon]
MQCHYCDEAADLTVDKEGIQVGLCEEHFRERLEELTESDLFEDLRDQLDIDRAE